MKKDLSFYSFHFYLILLIIQSCSTAYSIPIRTEPLTIEGKINSFFWHGPFEFAHSSETLSQWSILKNSEGPTYYFRIEASDLPTVARRNLTGIVTMNTLFSHPVFTEAFGEKEILVAISFPQSIIAKRGAVITVKDYTLVGDERGVSGSAAEIAIEGKPLIEYSEYRKQLISNVERKSLLSLIEKLPSPVNMDALTGNSAAITSALDKVYYTEGLNEMIQLWKLGEHRAVELAWWRSKYPNVRKLVIALAFERNLALAKREMTDNCKRFADYEAGQRLLEIEEVSKDLKDLSVRLKTLIGEKK